MMRPEQRKDVRKEYVKEISFESMLAERNDKGAMIRNGRSMDISHGGISLLAHHKSIEGEILKLSVPLNDLDITVPIFAEVIWVTEFQENYRAGLRFLV
jgi:hypothetical protein